MSADAPAPPTIPGVPPRGFVAYPGDAAAQAEAAAFAAAAAARGDDASKPASEHVRRDLRLAQAYNLVQVGDAWMQRPSAPNPRTKYSSASRLYEEAGDVFRAYGRWRFAGEAYAKAGDAEKRLGEPMVAATYFIDGGECMERVDIVEAVRCYARAVALYAVLGRFVSAATTQVRVAEIYEEDGAHHDAADAYQYAADYFIGDDLYTRCVQCLYHAGVCLCKEGASFRLAHDKFDRAAYFAADDNMAKLKVPQFMFDAGLCLLADGELTACEDYVTACCRRNEEFSVGREKRFLLDTIDVARAALLDDFIDHCWNYDYCAGLEPFEIAVLEGLYNEISKGPMGDRPVVRDDGLEEVEVEQLVDANGNPIVPF